ncbi:FAD-binding domain-containing protein [Tenacibaculum sp. SG-28]|uniref:FAD-binding domain-containing protein n=1 Tax=Tenacibaculum sp. SG-28 TaxID=754426 RepID=UPI000CF4828C|nr:FAD-binding domain-containing protein [Tenacibaculum sp. SG-28]PQJ23566.1 deoxyribodipyrimidine photolyase [Tenacibaculum sp. SG-28]
MNNLDNISVVWFKRDLRLHDNEAIFNALQTKEPLLLVYIFEPSLHEDAHYSERHWDFIKQSLLDLNHKLSNCNTKVLTVESEVIPFFSFLLSHYNIKSVFSHQETGIDKTYVRDKTFRRFCRNNSIQWIENVNNGVFRGRNTEGNWSDKWLQYMKAPQLDFLPEKEHRFLHFSEIANLEGNLIIKNLETKDSKVLQKGGVETAKEYFRSFFKERYINYAKYTASSALGRESYSRLSPYLAWGNLSVREVFQEAQKRKQEIANKLPMDMFVSRLKWQAHFIQKFETDNIMTEEKVSLGHNKLKKQLSIKYTIAWQEGKTGYPMIDASMRCLKETGYLNFKMRAMVVSFFTHNLWQPWQEASSFLSRLFLDFEPGIHLPQTQIQAAISDTKTIKNFNPTKIGLEYDPMGEFIVQWVPELKNLPVDFRHEPYKMSFIEQKLYNFNLGKDYPEPVVDIRSTKKRVSDVIWDVKDSNKPKQNKSFNNRLNN